MSSMDVGVFVCPVYSLRSVGSRLPRLMTCTAVNASAVATACASGPGSVPCAASIHAAAGAFRRGAPAR